MRNSSIAILLFFMLSFYSCKDNFIDTGLAATNTHQTMYEYFKGDPYNWDSLLVIINKAELKSMFDGTNSEYKSITFFGPTNFSIMKWMKATSKTTLSTLTKEECQTYLKKYVVKTLHMKKDIGYEIKGTTEGGTTLSKLDLNSIRVFLRKGDWGSVPDGGPVTMFVESEEGKQTIQVASADILTKTGVVHSLSYTYTFGKF